MKINDIREILVDVPLLQEETPDVTFPYKIYCSNHKEINPCVMQNLRPDIPSCKASSVSSGCFTKQAVFSKIVMDFLLKPLHEFLIFPK